MTISDPNLLSQRICRQCQTEQHALETSICPHSPLFSNDPLIATSVAGRYTITSVIGIGGWSTVYRASDSILNRAVAIKILHAHLCIDQGKLERFQREAEATSRLVHPHIAVIYDCGQIDAGRPYIAMELIEGTSLADTIARQKQLDPKQCIDLFGQICDGLDAIHKLGLIHRDLKPNNVHVSDSGTVKILDFGLAKWILQENQPLTKTDEAVGTPSYMSPEQCLGKQLDLRADIYSLGCMLYEALAGMKPFLSDNLLECMRLHMKVMPAKLSVARPDLDLPQALEDVVFKALAKDPVDRFASVAELKRALIASIQPQTAGQKLSSILPWRHLGQRQRRLSLAVAITCTALATASVMIFSQLNQQRLIKFPNGRPVGYISLVQKDANGSVSSTRFTFAQGAVRVPLRSIVELGEISNKVTANLSFLSQLQPGDIQRLDLYDKPVEAAGVLAINRLADLQNVSFNRSSIADDALSHLNLPQLDGIDLANTKVSDVSILSISNNEKQLHWLALTGNENVSDKGIAALTSLKSLDTLRLSEMPRLTDAVTVPLGQAPALTFLELAQDNITDDGVTHLCSAPRLQRLDLSGTKITDNGVKLLPKLATLRRLNLSETNISDDSIEALTQLQHLKVLNLGDTAISKEGFQRLKKALPDCDITPGA